MKFKILSSFISILFFIASCGSSQKDSSGNKLSPEELQAIEYFKNKVTGNAEITNYEVYSGDFPYILSPSFADAYAAFLMTHLFSSKITEADMIMFSKSLSAIAENEKIKYKNSDEKYITLCAEMKTTKDSIHYDDKKYIVVFKLPFDVNDEPEPTKFTKVDSDLFGIATLIGADKTGLTMEEIKTIGSEKEFLNKLNKLNDPILKFILEPVKDSANP